MAYTEQLKHAQIAKLKQRYLDLIEEAGRKKRETELAQQQSARESYAGHMQALRDLPQQLAAKGFGGGMGDEALRTAELAYRGSLDALEKARAKYLADYGYEIEKQSRLMQLALEEYLARTSGAAVKSAAQSGSSAKSSTKSSTKSSIVTKMGTGSTAQPKREKNAVGRSPVAYVSRVNVYPASSGSLKVMEER